MEMTLSASLLNRLSVVMLTRLMINMQSPQETVVDGDQPNTSNYTNDIETIRFRSNPEVEQSTATT